jgi:predicted DNA-binding protein with PD1-like motif
MVSTNRSLKLCNHKNTIMAEDTDNCISPRRFTIKPSQAPGKKYRLLGNNNGVKEYVLIFAKGDELLSGIRDFALEQKITAARFTAIGALQSAKTAWFDLSNKCYKINVVDRQSELISLIGDIGVYNETPVPHVHISVGLENGSIQGGHLLEAVAYPTVELFMTVFPEPLRKELDEETDLTLIHPEKQ